MRSSFATSRRRHGRRRGKPRPPQPEEDDTRDWWDEVPQLAAALHDLLGHHPRLTHPCPPDPAKTPSSSSSCRRRRRRGAGRGEEEARDWAGLPLDVVSAILHRLDHVEILMGAGQVCRSWRRAARDEPELWRRIDMRGHADLFNELNLPGMSQAAVKRSAGQCEAFWGEYAADDDLLLFLGDREPSLKSLRVISCYQISNEGFAEAIKKFPLLEELELSLCSEVFGKGVYEVVGKACPQLKRFRLSMQTFYNFDDDEYNKDGEALGIATMTELRHLQLFANIFTNEGLIAILDNCTHLESLDIRHCFNVVMDDTLQAKCAKIKTVRLPSDSTDDYDFQVHSPMWANEGIYNDSDDCFYGGLDYVLDSDEYDDYCDLSRYLDGVYEDESEEEDQVLLEAMRNWWLD